ncbi:reverse transcriptase domain-containing protein [Tanacetum coccineum]
MLAHRWILSDIKGVDPEFCTHKILMEEDYEPIVQSQRRVNPKIPDVIKKRLIKLLTPDNLSDLLTSMDFSKIARPMTYLLEKETPFFFSEECNRILNTLQKKLTEAPILIAPDWDLPFKLMCDASDFAIGAVLGQRKNKHFQPIHYASKTMSEAQTYYTTTEKELLAVVYAFKKFRSYLVLSKSIVYTDHSAIKYLFAKKDAKARRSVDTFCSQNSIIENTRQKRSRKSGRRPTLLSNLRTLTKMSSKQGNPTEKFPTSRLFGSICSS